MYVSVLRAGLMEQYLPKMYEIKYKTPELTCFCQNCTFLHETLSNYCHLQH